MLRDVFAECVRVLEPGGRICVNVANLGRKPYRSLSADVTRSCRTTSACCCAARSSGSRREGAGGQLRLGFVHEGVRQPGAARPDRADRRRRQGPVRPGASTGRSASRPGLPLGVDDRSATTSWRGRSTCGEFPPRVATPRRPPGAVPGRAAAPLHRALHLRRRRRARPVHGRGHHGRGRGSAPAAATSGFDTDPAYVELARSSGVRRLRRTTTLTLEDRGLVG